MLGAELWGKKHKKNFFKGLSLNYVRRRPKEKIDQREDVEI